MIEQQRGKQPPIFTIKPMNIQGVENEPARFECAVIGYPKPKVIWYINGNQAIHVTLCFFFQNFIFLKVLSFYVLLSKQFKLFYHFT